MNNGLLSFNLGCNAGQRSAKYAGSCWSQHFTSMPRLLAATLFFTSLLGSSLAGGLVVGVRSAQAQEADELPTLPMPSADDAITDDTFSSPPTQSDVELDPFEPSEQPSQPRAVSSDGAVFFEPTINPSTNPRIPRVLSVPGTQVNPASLSDIFDGYYLGPGDSIFVSVQRYPDLSFQATLDLQGNIVLPIEGAISLEGLTLAQANAKIRRLYDQYVTFDQGVDREVSLTLVAQRGVEVTILGAVQRPGFYPLTNPTVATALLTAGGATRTSDLRTIQIQRQIPQGNGFVEARVDVDLFTPLKEGSPLPDVRLEDGDVMIIPELEPDNFGSYDRNLVARSTLAQPVINVRFFELLRAGGGVWVRSTSITEALFWMQSLC